VPKIAVNALFARPAVGGGMRYLLGVLGGLREIDALDGVVVYTTRVAIPSFAPLGVAIRILPVNPNVALTRFVAEQVGLPALMRRERSRVIWSPAHVAPLLAAANHVVTVHDVRHHDAPAGMPLARRAYLEWGVPRSAAHAASVLTGSAFSRSRVHSLIPHADVRVVPYGIDRIFFDAGERRTNKTRRAARDRYARGAAYVAVVAPDLPHKDVPTAVRAVSLAGTGLAVVQCSGGGAAGMWRSSREHDGVTLHRWQGVADAELADLVANAEALLVPSRYEGYSFPLVEALAAGTPVVASDISALRDVAAGAARLARPGDPESFAAELRAVLDPGARAALVERGRARTVALTWRRSAEAHLALLATLA